MAMALGHLSLGCGFAVLASTAIAEPAENHLLNVVPVPQSRPVMLDGRLDEWNQQGAIVIANDDHTPTRLVRVSAMYDAEGLYLAFTFKDPTPMANKVDPGKSPSAGWRGDSVQLRLNCGPVEDGAPLIPELMHHIDCYWSASLQRPAAFVITTDMSRQGIFKRKLDDAIGKGIDAGFRVDDDQQGYVQEMRICWPLLRPNAEPYRPGEFLRMAIETVFDDGGGATERLVDLISAARPERDTIWKKPDSWGTARFLTADEAQNTPAANWQDWLSKYRPDPVDSDGHPLPADRPCRGNEDAVSRLLNQWCLQGTAAGNKGDLYDNRDRGHSIIAYHRYPQIQRTIYSPEQLKDRADWGLLKSVFPQATVAHSSTSAPPDRGGSNPRFAQTEAGLLQTQRDLYLHNNIGVYPEHQDYDPGRSRHPGHGDLYPLNAPYWLISQGSSGSDGPFVRALIQTLAAFRPDVKEALIREGLLMPTVQQILRSSNRQVVKPSDYFSGKAHPVVFRGDQLDELRMIHAANGMTLDSIPPLARMRVLNESQARLGIDAADDMPSESLCDLPEVIGRVHRRWAKQLTFRVSAAESFDRQDKPLSYRWALLQGDPARVRILPERDGLEAEIRVDWHGRFDVPGELGIQSNRVDIGLFVSNGKNWSTPAFFCVFHPDNELRTYDETGRLVDLYSAAIDPTIGYDTLCAIPADGLPAYDIRDWSTLSAALFDSESVASRVLGSSITPGQRAAVRDSIREVENALLQYQNATERARKQAGLGDAAALKPDPDRAGLLGRPLLLDREALGGASAKSFIEATLNDAVEDATWYLRNVQAFAQLDGPAQQTLESLRDQLVELGIYPPAGGGWELYSVRVGAGSAEPRLTRYERMEIARFHLGIITQVLLPGIVVREARPNYVDDRITATTPTWSIFRYENSPDARPVVEHRVTGRPIVVPKRLSP